VAKLTRLTYKIVIQLYQENCRQVYHLQFLLQAASLETLGYPSYLCLQLPTNHLLLSLLIKILYQYSSFSSAVCQKLSIVSVSNTVVINPEILTLEVILKNARFEVFMALEIQVEVFWDVTLCTVVVGYKHFRGICCMEH
jgi:hypothetical protein